MILFNLLVIVPLSFKAPSMSLYFVLACGAGDGSRPAWRGDALGGVHSSSRCRGLFAGVEAEACFAIVLELPLEDIYTLPTGAFQQAMIAEISTLRAPTVAQNLTKRIADDSVQMANDLRVSASELVTIEQKTATDLSEIRSLLDELVRQDKTGVGGDDGAQAANR